MFPIKTSDPTLFFLYYYPTPQFKKAILKYNKKKFYINKLSFKINLLKKTNICFVNCAGQLYIKCLKLISK